jgi:hypothetical protein
MSVMSSSPGRALSDELGGRLFVESLTESYVAVTAAVLLSMLREM